MFNQFLQLIEQLDKIWIFLFIFGSAFIENIFPPYPGDTVIAFGGYLAGKKIFSLFTVATSSFIGSVLSAIIMYFFGEKVLYLLQKYLLKYSWAKFLEEKNLHKSQVWMEKYGVWIVIFSRFSAGIRFFVAIVAGIIRMNFFLFVVAFSLATALWNFILIYFSYQIGENWQQVTEVLKIYNAFIMFFFFVIVGTWIFINWKKKK